MNREVEKVFYLTSQFNLADGLTKKDKKKPGLVNTIILDKIIDSIKQWIRRETQNVMIDEKEIGGARNGV